MIAAPPMKISALLAVVILVVFAARATGQSALPQLPLAEEPRHEVVRDWPALPDGSFYVSDGYRNMRVVKFDAASRYDFEWGSKGAEPGKFNLPHGVAVDERGRVFAVARDGSVYVAEGAGKRVQKFIRESP